MKKLMMAMVAAFAAAMPMMADMDTANGYTWTYRINGDTVEIYNEWGISAISPPPTGAVTVPSMLGGKPVTGIGDYAFEGCGALTSVTIPAGITRIGKWAFHDGECNVSSFLVLSGSTSFKVVDGFLLSYDGTVLVACPSAKSGTATIPAGVTTIAATAFDDCDNLTSVKFPESLTTIEEYSFHDCGQITSIVIPDGVTTIGQYAFSKCKRLARAELPVHFNGTLAATVFSDCAKNPKITYRARPTGATRFDKAQTKMGALYDAKGLLVGVVELKCGKISKTGTVKVSASVTMLDGGKSKKVTAKAVKLDVGADGSLGITRPATLVFKKPIGNMTFEMDPDGMVTLSGSGYEMRAAEVGADGALLDGEHKFRINGFDLEVPGKLQKDLLPDGEAFIVKGKKWTFAKAASVKVTKDHGLFVDTSKDKTNLSGLKLAYKQNTGLFKGSFKAYALEDANGGAKKLKKYTVSVIGFVVGGEGAGQVTVKKLKGGPWPVTLE